MFNINDVKVGIGIVAKDDQVGYIKEVDYKNKEFVVRNNIGLIIYNLTENKDYYFKHFKQIGTYVFEDKDKVKIEPLTSYVEEVYAFIRGGHNKVTEYKHEPSNEQIVDKINEIIKWINERG